MALSGLNNDEYLALLAGYEIIIDPVKWSCERCIRSTLPDQRKAKGCAGGVTYTLETFSVKKCIGNLYKPWVVQWYGLFQHFKNGVMPFRGSILEQPAKAMEIFNIFQGLENQTAKKQAKADELKAKRKR